MDDIGTTTPPRNGTHPLRCAAALRRHAPQQGWTTHQLVAVIVGHCRHGRLRAHRLARGWTLAAVIHRMVSEAGVGQRLVTSRVSRWERADEQPSALYRDALCRIYSTGPVDLGLSTDYRTSGPTEAVDNAPPDQLIGSNGWRIPGPRHESDAVDEAVVAPAVECADRLRRRIDEALSASTVSDATIAYKESVADQYGRTYKTEPAGRFLRDILADLEDVRVITDQKLPSAQRRDLCVVTARLAGLVSMTMVNLGRYRQARDLVHTARLAVDEAGDAHLRAWVATRAAVAALHLGDPQAAVAAAREAEVFTRNRPDSITAMAWAILARAAATMHEPSATRTALQQVEKLSGTTTGGAENTAYRFTAGQLHFYRSHALTTIGETRAAWQAQDDALAAFGPGERLDPTLVHLDRALCLVGEGNINQGSEYATTVLLSLPVDHRLALITRRADAVASAVPVARRGLPAVRALHDALAISAGPS